MAGCLLLTVSSIACAEKSGEVNAVGNSEEFSDCDITLSSTNTLGNIEDAVISEPVHSIDPDSGEHVLTQTVDYQNGDSATIKQSFCYLYNFKAEYSLKRVSNENFNLALSRIDHLILNAKQDYQLKAALVDVVELMMNLNGFNTNTPFDYGLPVQAVISSHYVEHGLSFKTAIENTAAPAMIDVYFSLGGQQ